MNKTEKIKLHLIEKGDITSWEAIKLYGATRLSGIIYNLRYHYGMNIISERTDFVDRFGSKSSYAKYILIDKEEKKNV